MRLLLRLCVQQVNTYITTKSGVQYEVRFGRRRDNILHVTIVFGITNEEYEGAEFTVTSKGELYRVMNTIVKIVKIFMAEHPKMTCYEFTGIGREGEIGNKTSVRINLYRYGICNGPMFNFLLGP